MAIAIGLALGADQREVSVIALPIILAVISLIDRLRKNSAPASGNLILSIEVNHEEAISDKILEMIESAMPNANIRRIDQNENLFSIVALVKIMDKETINHFSKDFQARFPQGDFPLSTILPCQTSKFSCDFHPTKENSHNAKLGFVAFGVLFLAIGIFLAGKISEGYLKANFITLQKLNLLQVIQEKNQLDTLRLEIPFKGMQTLNAKRKDALNANLLVSTDDDFVKARISYLNESLNFKIRLKGDLSDHWSGEKFSLRVEMKDDSLIKGMSRFSLQDPVTRNHTSEWLYQKSLKRERCDGCSV